MTQNKTLLSAVIAVFCACTLTSACQSMNGISRKAVLLGIDKNGKPRPPAEEKPATSTDNKPANQVPEEYPGEQSNQVPVFIETSGAGKLIPLNVSYDMLRKTLETLEEIHRDPHVFNITSGPNQHAEGSRDPEWFYPRQTNSTRPILIQSLTKSNQYVDLNYVRVSALNSTGGRSSTVSFINGTVALVGDESPEALFLRLFNTTDNDGPANASETMAKEIATKLLHQPSTTPEPRRLPPMVAIPPPATANGEDPDEMEEDERIRYEWGGECTVADWKSCYNITVMGNPTKVHPLHPNDRKKNIMTQLNCFDTNEAIDFPWLCLRNGWTVNRCHILCMSKCNREFLYTRKWDFYVLHEGACKTK